MILLASYKIRFHDEHVRAVPARDEAGCPFAGPGVDVRGEEARPLLALATPFRAWLDAREPGVTLRTLSVDVPAHRVLITLEPMAADQRPRVVRIDPPHADELIAAAAPLEAAIGAVCIAKLRRRLPEGGRAATRVSSPTGEGPQRPADPSPAPARRR